jgi:hypothetical protein
MSALPSSFLERRRYYRIDDNVILNYRVIPPDQVEQTLAHFQEGIPERFDLTSAYATNDAAMAEALSRIRAEQPMVAFYLEALDRKLNLLARLAVSGGDDLSAQPTRRVNLSGGGITFGAEQEIPCGTILEMKLVIFPTYTGILAYGPVVHCHKETDTDARFPWQVAASFSHIRDADRDLLVRHTLHCQAAWLRQRQLAE